jgi:hypothetical protein
MFSLDFSLITHHGLDCRGKPLFGHFLQLRAHSYSVQLISTTHFQLLRTQGHMFSHSDTAVASVLQTIQSCYVSDFRAPGYEII